MSTGSADGEQDANGPPSSANDSTPANPWQAIFSPQHNAYYFYNSVTQETTWTNPLHPDPSPSAPSAAEGTDPSLSTSSALQSTEPPLSAPSALQGIDPALAHLDPTLMSGINPGAPSATPTFTAKFNARTGTFTRPDARDPSHLSEYERAKRMSEFYFDVNAWETQREGDMEMSKGEEGRKRKRPTKKDLDRFKEQKRLKKIAKTAWLRQ